MLSKLFTTLVFVVSAAFASARPNFEITVSKPDLDLCGTCTQLDGYVYF